MLVDVEILNILKYTDKKTGEDKCALSYRLLNEESKANTPKFKGYSNLTIFMKNTDLFDKFESKYFGKHLVLELVETQNVQDPMKKTIVLKSIKNEKNEDLYLL